MLSDNKMTDKEIDSDSDAPEEFTAHQGLQQDEELRKVQRENKSRVAREGKERRRQIAQKLTPRSRPKEIKSEKDETETQTETNEDTVGNKGMLPDDIVKLLAANEKKVFTSDSEDEQVDQKHVSKKRNPGKTGLEPFILKDIPTAQCAQKSLDFLEKRKMQVSRSSAVLNNSNQALRLLSNTGLLKQH